ncbi:PIR protein [Plasmodium yoelii]|uniref:PIR protein n=4 Tax=Plasmodium yoelii TaxID=5861 RepID=A0AAF0B3N1_PLAYO|nr:PIR protein [Plasmodium yoelii]WBY56971.1 PIR protein [Plasmodium yoelii yoelii]CDU17766.1 YIR protein [Plasmodium yoelii]VTZ77812.1 PIR protein [Plasmodium yoelii]|eukprot:XP_022812073.1 PIR protein [Plasmodium yoelii]
MGEQRMCELFLEADKLIKSNIDITKKVNETPTYREYCPHYRRCSNKVESIGALGRHIFMNLWNPESINYEYFMMWLANKLYNLNEDKNEANNITLNLAYKKYLEKYIGNFKYWNFLLNVGALKDANLRYMSELYTLLSHICNTIEYYKKNDDKHKKLYLYSANCLNQYRNLYNNIPKCNSYLYLLDNLKKIYTKFRDSVINEKKNKIFENHLQKLTIPNKKDLYFAKDFKEFDFNCLECKPKNKDNIQSGQHKAVKPIQITPKSTNQGSQQRTHEGKADNLKVSEPESQQQKGIQFPKTEYSSLKGGSKLKDVPTALKLVSNGPDTHKDPDSQKGPDNQKGPDSQKGSDNGQINPGSESETNKDQIDISTSPKDNHDVFDLSTLKEYGNLITTYIEEYRTYVTNSFNDIQKKLYDNVLPTLYEGYNTYVDYYKSLNIMEYFKEGTQSNETPKTEILEDNPPSNGLDDMSPLSDSEPPDAEESEPQDPQTQMLVGQINDYSQQLLSTSEIDSTNSEQEKTLNTPHEDQHQSLGGSTNIEPSPEIEIGNPGIVVRKDVSEIQLPKDPFKEYKLIIYSVMAIILPITLAIIYKNLASDRRKRLKRMREIVKMCDENENEGEVTNESIESIE